MEHFGVKTEVIFVNWNPVPDQTQIIDQIRWPSDRKHVQYKIITVPTPIHEKFIDPNVRDTVPLFEFIAKNVGIRRAVGEHILCINADVLIHPRIIKFVASGKLKTDTYYRADRWDYASVETLSLENLYEKGIMLFMKGFRYDLEGVVFKRTYHSALKILNRARLFWNLWKERHTSISNRYGFNVVYDNGGYIAHCHASGDFMLMTKENWFLFRAYPEYTSISTHTDSLFTILVYSRLKERVFCDPVFHQAHQRRYDWSDISNNEKFRSAYRLFESTVNLVKEGGAIENSLNPMNWGLQDEELIERTF
ncbi:MAG: hypothetical protein H6603_04280 [Flavobacteriales bacterium]|nr:hypothetical protein [Flavobacteriales bacterium]MCB9204177.1 hypothetical protein [Flavobacteriales bacterium]